MKFDTNKKISSLYFCDEDGMYVGKREVSSPLYYPCFRFRLGYLRIEWKTKTRMTATFADSWTYPSFKENWFVYNSRTNRIYRVHGHKLIRIKIKKRRIVKFVKTLFKRTPKIKEFFLKGFMGNSYTSGVII